jgi:hypothetical protein
LPAQPINKSVNKSNGNIKTKQKLIQIQFPNNWWLLNRFTFLHVIPTLAGTVLLIIVIILVSYTHLAGKSEIRKGSSETNRNTNYALVVVIINSKRTIVTYHFVPTEYPITQLIPCWFNIATECGNAKTFSELHCTNKSNRKNTSSTTKVDKMSQNSGMTFLKNRKVWVYDHEVRTEKNSNTEKLTDGNNEQVHKSITTHVRVNRHQL